MTQSTLIADDTPLAAAQCEIQALAAGMSHRVELTRQRREHHRWMLALSLFILAMSFLLQIRDRGTVDVPWLNVALPTLCGSRTLFNVECPGCGLTRSFIALAAGDVQGSLRYHRLGWILALAVAAQIPYRSFALWELRSKGMKERIWPMWFGYFLIAALIANWLLKMVI